MTQDKNKSVSRSAPGMLEWPNSVERLPNGNTLIADGGDVSGNGSEVIEVDPLGNIVWQYDNEGGFLFLHSARLLKSGNILLSDSSNDRVIEVNRDKQIVFNTDEWDNGTGKLSDGSHIAYPNDAYELEDGNLFICERNNNRAFKVDRQGNVLWVYDKDIDRPHNGHMLPNGNMLICASDINTILEVSPAKEIVWSYGDDKPETLDWPRAARRLENGNTMICDSKNSRIVEVTTKGQVVWQFKVNYFSKFYDFQVLPDDNILISDTQHRQVIEVDRSGNYRWVYRNFHLLDVELKLKNGFFKEQDETGVPLHWQLARLISEGGGELIWDKENKPYPCPGLEYDRSGFLYLHQVIAVKPGARYKLAGKIRTEGVKGSCSIQLCFLDKYGGQVYDMEDIPKGDFYMGDNDWTLDTIEAKAPEGATSVELRLSINDAGKVWFKEMMFHS